VKVRIALANPFARNNIFTGDSMHAIVGLALLVSTVAGMVTSGASFSFAP